MVGATIPEGDKRTSVADAGFPADELILASGQGRRCMQCRSKSIAFRQDD